MKSYLTVEEYKRVPSGINTENLDYFSGITNSNAQDAELLNVIQRASSFIDSFCTLPYGFSATLVTETKATTMAGDGYLRIRTNSIPIIELKSLRYRMFPGSQWLDLDLNSVQMYERYFETSMLVPYYGSPITGYSYPVTGPYFPYLSPNLQANLQDRRMTVQYSYVSGYPHTEISVDALAGDSTITVVDSTGIKAGMTLTIYDGAFQEDVYVSADPVSNAISLSRPLLHNHKSGVGFSSIPADIKQACILLVNYFLKERSVNSITMEGVTNPLMQKYDDVRDIDLAKQLLRKYKRVSV